MSKKTKRNKPTILNVPLKRPTPGDLEALKGVKREEMADVKAANEAPKQPTKADEEMRIHQFPDGAFLKFAINPLRPNTFVIYDGKNVAYAAANQAVIANLICNSVNFALHYQRAEQEKQAKAASDLADALTTDPPKNVDAANADAVTATKNTDESPANVVPMEGGPKDGQA